MYSWTIIAVDHLAAIAYESYIIINTHSVFAADPQALTVIAIT